MILFKTVTLRFSSKYLTVIARNQGSHSIFTHLDLVRYLERFFTNLFSRLFIQDCYIIHFSMCLSIILAYSFCLKLLTTMQQTKLSRVCSRVP